MALLRFAWQVALRDIQTCLATCLVRRFQKMRCSFHGRRSTSDVSCCVFFANRIVRAASSGDKVQIPWQVWNFGGSLARNIDFVVANSEGHKRTRRNTSILKLQSVKNGGSLARNARFDAPTCLVSSLWFSSGLAVSMGEIAKPILLHGVKASCSVLLRQA